MKAVLPDSLKQEVEQLQDTFGAVMNQAIMLTDQEGQLITRPSLPDKLNPELFHLLFNVNRPFGSALHRLGSLPLEEVAGQVLPGLQYAVIPLVRNERNYYLWSGLYIENGGKQMTLDALAVQFSSHPDYKRLQAELTAMPELEREALSELRSKRAALAGIAAKLLADEPSRGEATQRREECCGQELVQLKKAARLLPLAATMPELGNRLLEAVSELDCGCSSVFVYFARLEDPERCVAQGWVPGSAQLYLSDIEARYSPYSFLASAIINESYGQVRVECPLIVGGTFQGLLSVGFWRREDAEEWRLVLETLAAVAGSAVLLVAKNQEYARQSAVLLANVRGYLEQSNTGLQRLSLDASDMVYDLAEARGFTAEEAGLVQRAALLAPFRNDFLEELGFFKDEQALLRQLDRLAAAGSDGGWVPLSLPAQALALVLAYIGEEAGEEKLSGGYFHPWLNDSRFKLAPAAAYAAQEELRSAFRTLVQSRTESRSEEGEASAPGLLGSEALISLKAECGISPREEEVLELIVQGRTNKEIASALFISEHTVKNHLSRIFYKMNVTDRSQVIAQIYQRILFAGTYK